MATTIYDIEVVELIDGSLIELRPLKIKLLREFMSEFTKGISDEENTTEDSSLDLLMRCVGIAMKQYKPELALEPEKLEDVLDMPTIYKIIDVAAGIKLNDPNLLAAAGLSGTN